MSRKARFWILVGIVFMTLVAANSAFAAGPTYKFAVIIYDTAGNPWWKPMVNGVNETAKLLGVEANIQYADNQPDKQNDLIENAITNKVDGIVLAINVPDAYNKNVTRAMKAGIPVVAMNIDDPKGADGSDRLAFMGQDFKIAGYVVTKRLIKEGNLKAGDFVVAPVEHPEATYAKERYMGVKKALDEAGIKSEVLDTGAVSLEDTLNKITQYLIGHKNTNGILAMGGMPLSQSAKAVKDAGMNIPVAGFDLTQQIVKDIMAGRILAAVDQQPYYQGALPLFQLYLYRKYGLSPCDVNTGGAIVDRFNAEQVLKLSGTYR